MSVRKDPSGRRWVQVEVEVPGTPEEVWNAIATGPGVTSWFVPTRIETDENGKPVRVVVDFGPGMESVAEIKSWNPPHNYVAESGEPGSPPLATEWIVESLGGGKCVVRVVHSLFADGSDWDGQLEGAEQGWPDFFRLLRLYLTHFRGLAGSTFQLMAMPSEPRPRAWATLTGALGFTGVAAGDRRSARPEVPALAGVVERVGEPAHPEELILRLDRPTPGLVHAFAFEMGEQVVVGMRFYLYGAQAQAVAAQDETRWQAWLQSLFPQGGSQS